MEHNILGQSVCKNIWENQACNFGFIQSTVLFAFSQAFSVTIHVYHLMILTLIITQNNSSRSIWQATKPTCLVCADMVRFKEIITFAEDVMFLFGCVTVTKTIWQLRVHRYIDQELMVCHVTSFRDIHFSLECNCLGDWNFWSIVCASWIQV